MAQVYSNPKRESDPHALPDVETFYISAETSSEACPGCNDSDTTPERIEGVGRDYHAEHVGWYWQPCFPGCLPDGEPNGPFTTEQEAIEDAQSGSDDGDETDDSDEQE